MIQGACTGANAAYADTATCMAACNAMNQTGTIGDTAGYNVHCHIYHAGAAFGDAALHCQHASATGGGACGTRCENYCQTIMTTCTGANAQFANTAECMRLCATNPDGAFKDVSGNTKDCRIYHAYAAVATNNATLHCPHAGHTGGGACGTYCEVYCNLATTVCTGANQLYSNLAACTSACPTIPGTGKIGDTMGNTVQCRIYHLGVASTDAASATLHCPHANATATSQCVGGATTTPTTASTETKKSNAFGLFVSLVTLIVSLI
jgi:hypothetical protein